MLDVTQRPIQFPGNETEQRPRVSVEHSTIRMLLRFLIHDLGGTPTRFSAANAKHSIYCLSPMSTVLTRLKKYIKA